MPVYEVSFFKDIVNSCGKEFRARQRALQIRSAKTLERAVEAAKRRFARLERVADWRLHASDVEVEILDEPHRSGIVSSGAAALEALGLADRCLTGCHSRVPGFR